MEGLEKSPRLGVVDKRYLWATLQAIVDRLLMLNRFPVDQYDFALSCLEPEVEAAWRLLRDKHEHTLSTTDTAYFVNASLEEAEAKSKFILHDYTDENKSYAERTRFPNIAKFVMTPDNKYFTAVNEWTVRQQRLEAQVLRANRILKSIVHSCNTVGQYREVSPDLIPFIPEKYQLALKDYVKRSPYPAMTVEPEEIDTTLSILAYASLQPMHPEEKQFVDRPKWSNYSSYSLDPWPRSQKFISMEVRKLQI